MFGGEKKKSTVIWLHSSTQPLTNALLKHVLLTIQLSFQPLRSFLDPDFPAALTSLFPAFHSTSKVRITCALFVCTRVQ